MVSCNLKIILNVTVIFYFLFIVLFYFYCNFLMHISDPSLIPQFYHYDSCPLTPTLPLIDKNTAYTLQYPLLHPYIQELISKGIIAFQVCDKQVPRWFMQLDIPLITSQAFFFSTKEFISFEVLSTRPWKSLSYLRMCLFWIQKHHWDEQADTPKNKGISS